MANTQSLTLVLTAANLLILVVSLTQQRPASAQSDGSVLRGGGLELVDPSGRVRAQFIVEADGEAVFRLRDKTGTIRVKLGASEDGSGLLLLDGRTEPGVQISTGRQSAAGSTPPSITLTDPKGARRVITPQN